MNYKGKIGFCNNYYLNINKVGGHYVLIHDIDKKGNCDVSVVTSLEDINHVYNLKKLKYVRNGYTYQIPFNDSNLARWSGIDLSSTKKVDISNISNIGVKHLKRKHLFYVGKFRKK